jgi:hypothetical protein
MHDLPSPSCPEGQAQVKLPGVFVQVAAASHVLVWVVHSSMSVQVTPVPE